MSEMERKVYVDERIGKPLSKNIFDKSGLLLYEKGTILTEDMLARLSAGSISVLKKPRPKRDGNFEFVPPQPVTEEKHFKLFNQKYEEKKEEVERLIVDISTGGVVDIDAIASQTSDMMSQLENKKDLLKYLSFIEGTDDVTYGHSINVSLLCNLFGQWLGMNDEELRLLTAAGMLHDIGKTLIPPEIITKAGKLTDAEFTVIKQHPELGCKLLKERGVAVEIQYAALMHHERVNGNGYPYGLAGDKIHKMASIVSICDIYDAMTADRSYRNKLCPFTIIDTFEHKFYGDLHTEYLFLFLEKISHSFKNHMVLLSNDEVGEVIHIHPHAISRPLVRTPEDTFINLADEKSLFILEVF